jgi:hypothetical protein
MVIIYHSVTGSPGMTPAQLLFLRVAGQGWMGMDLFFVLSGFLITGILLDIRNPAWRCGGPGQLRPSADTGGLSGRRCVPRLRL